MRAQRQIRVNKNGAYRNRFDIHACWTCLLFGDVLLCKIARTISIEGGPRVWLTIAQQATARSAVWLVGGSDLAMAMERTLVRIPPLAQPSRTHH